ncbi:MAG: hypothetical protein GXP54_08950 [Deltaproteobacteria bacterium]|nr:hypothetical protein [Deltaproteobacteria bacterium]
MRSLIIGGTPSSGKTCAVLWMSRRAPDLGRMGVVKVDCVTTDDQQVLESRNIPATTILAGGYCPDHVLMERLDDMQSFADERRLDTLVIETAGLCGRCAPFLTDRPALCVLDCSAGIHAPAGLGPLLTDADICLVTKGDLVSHAEREVFAAGVRNRNPGAKIVWFNGLTGEGIGGLYHALMNEFKHGFDDAVAPRTGLPRLYCSYCLGRSEVET